MSKRYLVPFGTFSTARLTVLYIRTRV